MDKNEATNVLAGAAKQAGSVAGQIQGKVGGWLQTLLENKKKAAAIAIVLLPFLLLFAMVAAPFLSSKKTNEEQQKQKQEEWEKFVREQIQKMQQMQQMPQMQGPEFDKAVHDALSNLSKVSPEEAQEAEKQFDAALEKGLKAAEKFGLLSKPETGELRDQVAALKNEVQKPEYQEALAFFENQASDTDRKELETELKTAFEKGREDGLQLHQDTKAAAEAEEKAVKAEAAATAARAAAEKAPSDDNAAAAAARAATEATEARAAADSAASKVAEQTAEAAVTPTPKPGGLNSELEAQKNQLAVAGQAPTPKPGGPDSELEAEKVQEAAKAKPRVSMVATAGYGESPTGAVRASETPDSNATAADAGTGQPQVDAVAPSPSVEGSQEGGSNEEAAEQSKRQLTGQKSGESPADADKADADKNEKLFGAVQKAQPAGPTAQAENPDFAQRQKASAKESTSPSPDQATRG